MGLDVNSLNTEVLLGVTAPADSRAAACFTWCACQVVFCFFVRGKTFLTLGKSAVRTRPVGRHFCHRGRSKGHRSTSEATDGNGLAPEISQISRLRRQQRSDTISTPVLAPVDGRFGSGHQSRQAGPRCHCWNRTRAS